FGVDCPWQAHTLRHAENLVTVEALGQATQQLIRLHKICGWWVEEPVSMIAASTVDNTRCREVKPAQADQGIVRLVNIHKQCWKTSQAKNPQRSACALQGRAAC